MAYIPLSYSISQLTASPYTVQAQNESHIVGCLKRTFLLHLRTSTSVELLFDGLFQVQVVLYESHSMSQEENAKMVQSAVDCMNEWALQKHTEEQRLLQEHEEGIFYLLNIIKV